MGSRPADGSKAQSSNYEHPFFLAKNYARLGDVDHAIKCLEQSYKEHDCLLVLLKSLEWFGPLRKVRWTMEPIALVTGSTNNIGKSIAEALARKGYHLIVTSRNGEEAKGLSESLPVKGSFFQVDF